LIKKIKGKLNLRKLSRNPAAADLIRLKNVDWYDLTQNPAAYTLIIKNLKKVHLNVLYSNPAVWHLLEEFICV